MAWIYLAESEDSQKPWLRGSDRWPIVKTIDIAKLYSFLGWLMGICQRHPLPIMCKPLKGKDLEAVLTLSMLASHARISVLQELEKAWQESEADYFSRSYGLHASYDLSSFSWKMSQVPLPFLDPLPESWPRFAMIVDGECYELMTWERRILERDGFVLPTITASQGGYNKSSPKGKIRPTLATMARNALWPTPRAFMHKDSIVDRGKSNLGEVVGGTLNPTWVEWLMGYHLGWTALEDWAMLWFRSKRVKHSKD